MTRIRNLIASWLDVAEAALDAWAAELRMTVTAREAASVEEFNTRLIAVTASEEERENARQAAIVVAQLGASADDIAPALFAHYRQHIEETP